MDGRLHGWVSQQINKNNKWRKQKSFAEQKHRPTVENCECDLSCNDGDTDYRQQ